MFRLAPQCYQHLSSIYYSTAYIATVLADLVTGGHLHGALVILSLTRDVISVIQPRDFCGDLNMSKFDGDCNCDAKRKHLVNYAFTWKSNCVIANNA